MQTDPRIQPPANLIGFKVRRLHNLLNQQWTVLARRMEVQETPVESGILMIVGSNPGLAHTPLAELLGVDTSTLSQALAPLFERGLIRHEPAPEDRRARRLFLTETGTAAMDRVARLIEIRQSQLPGDLSQDEAETLHRLLDKMLALR